MRKEEKAALDVLAKASDVHNCWAILDDAVASGEDDQFTKEYIEGEREMLEGSIKGAIRALGTLGGLYGIVANNQNDNGSYAYMRKVRDEHLTELERAKEFDRGYQAGRQAMDAERYAVALRLMHLPLDGGSHENLSQIARAVYHADFGWTKGACRALRDELVRLMGGDQPSGIDVLREMDEESDADGTSPNDVPTPSITNELRAWAHGLSDPWKLSVEEPLLAIADRIDEQFDRICWQQEKVLQQTIDEMVDERDELQVECDRLTAALDELHADPANDVICRLERERDELQAKLDKIMGVLDGRD